MRRIIAGTRVGVSGRRFGDTGRGIGHALHGITTSECQHGGCNKGQQVIAERLHTAKLSDYRNSRLRSAPLVSHCNGSLNTLRQNYLRRLQQIRRAANLRPDFFARLSPEPRRNEDHPLTPRSLGHEHISQPIAHHPALREIRPQLSTHLMQHGGLGLATSATLVRAVRTEVAPLDRDPMTRKIGEQMLLKIMKVLLAVIASTDAALVRNDREGISGVPQALQALDDLFQLRQGTRVVRPVFSRGCSQISRAA